MYDYYHVTPARNLAKISKKGLMPAIGERSAKLENNPAIYLFNTLEDVSNALMNWLSDEFDEEQLALLKVSLDTPPADSHYETVIDSVIPPDKIKVLTKDIDTFNFNMIENKKPRFKQFLETKL